MKPAKKAGAEGFNLGAYEWAHAAAITDEGDKRAVLAYFVERVRAGQPVNEGILAFLADGIERYLDGKKPWPGTRGIKKYDIETRLRLAYPLWAEYRRILDDWYKQAKRITRPDGSSASVIQGNEADAIAHAAENKRVSTDTMKRAIDLMQRERFTYAGAPIVQALEVLYAAEHHGRGEAKRRGRTKS